MTDQGIELSYSNSQLISEPSTRRPLEEIGMEEKDEGYCPERTLWTRIWQGVGIASIVFNICSMALSDNSNAAVILAGIVACLIAPVVIYRQFEMQDVDSMRKEQNILREEVNRLQSANNVLHSNVNRLESRVKDLKKTEGELQALTKAQGTSVDEFVALVKENRETLDKMKDNVKAAAMQTIVKGVLSSDIDYSSHFSDNELPMLEINILAGLKAISGVSCERERLRQALKDSDRTLEAILALVDFDTNVPENKRVFFFDEDQVTKEGHVKKVV